MSTALVLLGLVLPAGAEGQRESRTGGTVVFVPPRIDPKGCPPPAYPELSRRRGEEGRIALEAETDSSGRVRSLALVERCRFPLLNEACRKAVSKWVLKPALRNGLPVEGKLRIPFSFQLLSESSKKR